MSNIDTIEKTSTYHLAAVKMDSLEVYSRTQITEADVRELYQTELHFLDLEDSNMVALELRHGFDSRVRAVYRGDNIPENLQTLVNDALGTSSYVMLTKVDPAEISYDRLRQAVREHQKAWVG